jgi:hypothetical protein
MKRVLLGALGVSLIVPSMAAADQPTPLVPFTVQLGITTPAGWFRIQDMHVVILEEGSAKKQAIPGLIGLEGHPLGRWWNCVAVGGFAERHMCELGKTNQGGCLVRIRLGHDNVTGPALMTIRHTGDVPSDVHNWRSYAMNVPESIRGAKPLGRGDPRVQAPLPVVQPKVLRYYSSVGGYAAANSATTPSEAAIRGHLAQLAQRGCDWVLFEWDGPDSRSDRVLRRLLPIAATQNTQVAVAIRCPKSRAALLSWTGALVGGHGRHPAFARVDNRPVVFFARETAMYFNQDMWKAFFTKYHQRHIRSFNVIEGYEPQRLVHFDGVYCNPTSKVGTSRVRQYVAAYVHALYRRKAFASHPVDQVAVSLKPGHKVLLEGYPPTWVVKGDGREATPAVAKASDGELTVQVAASQPTAQFSVAGYYAPGVRKIATRRRIHRKSWRNDNLTAPKANTNHWLTDPKLHKLYSPKHISKYSWSKTTPKSYSHLSIWTDDLERNRRKK